MIRIPLYQNAVIPILLILTPAWLVACGRHGTAGVTSTATRMLSNTTTETAKPTLTLTRTILPTRMPTTTSTPAPTYTLSLTKTPTKTIQPSPTWTFTPTQLIATPQPFLISYTEYSDGGDDLWICLHGLGRPSFILYTDGQLVYLRDHQYWQAFLSQDEITMLLDEISSTGLLQRSEKDYNGGNSELVLNGKFYYAAWDTPDSDPLSQALNILFHYQPKKVARFVPKNLELIIVGGVNKLDIFAPYFPQPTPEIRTWEGDPLAEYGVVWEVIQGDEVTKVMKQFDNFPGTQILKKGQTYYVAAICANNPP